MAEAAWWKRGVVYQIYPRSFRDSNGDGIGDLAGITERLPYVAALGVDAIWISPFFRSPMLDFGYDVSDYRDVDPMFGTLGDFDALISRAHELGVRVLIDRATHMGHLKGCLQDFVDFLLCVFGHLGYGSFKVGDNVTRLLADPVAHGCLALSLPIFIALTIHKRRLPKRVGKFFGMIRFKKFAWWHESAEF